MRQYLLSIIFCTTVALPVATYAVGIGPDSDNPSLLTSHKLPENGDTWTIGDGDPVLITADKNAGVWKKTLQPFFEGNALPDLPVFRFEGDQLFLTEFLEIEAEPNWIGWREELVDANGWGWVSGVIEFGDNDDLGDVVPGSFATIGPDEIITFQFDPLPAGTVLEIRKALECFEQLCTVSAELHEYAVVPLPVAFWLFAGAMSALGFANGPRAARSVAA